MRRSAELDARFSALYEAVGRPSIPPERLLRATLLQLLYSIRSERQLVERLEFDMLFRWFVGLIDRREGFRRLDLLQEPRPSAHARDRARVSGFASQPSGGEGADERGAFFGRRDFAQGLGVDEELSAQGWLGRAAFAGAQWGGGFPQDEAVERNARLDDGQGCAPVQKGRRAGEPSLLSRPCADGEPQRARGWPRRRPWPRERPNARRRSA